MVFLSDPLSHFSRDIYDLEGLSDWRLAEIPDPKVQLPVLLKDQGLPDFTWTVQKRPVENLLLVANMQTEALDLAFISNIITKYTWNALLLNACP